MMNTICLACLLAFVNLALTACNTYDVALNAPLIPERISFAAARLYPVGIAYAPTLGQFMVSSVTLGKADTVDEKGHYADFVDDKRLISGIGMKAHDGKLYVCNSDQGVSEKSTPQTTLKIAGLLIVDLATRQTVNLIRLDSLLPGINHFANDMAFDDQGNAYVTDSFAPVIYKVTTDYKATIWANNPLFAGAQGINLNGIVYHPNKYLIVVKANEGKLFKVELSNPNKVTEITGVTLPGGDGMVLYEKDLYVVHGRSKVSQVRSSDDWETASIVKTDSVGYDQATTNVVAEYKVYTLNARIGEVSAAVVAKNPGLLQASTYSIQQFK